EKAFPHDAAAAGLDAASAVHQLEGRGGRRENAVADQERGAVERDILMRGCAEGDVIERERAAGHLDARRAIAFNESVGDAGLRRSDAAVDGQATPAGA